MKVTIDTKEDGYEDMKKILYLLSSIMDKKGETSAVDSTTMMNMFDNSSSSQDKAPEFSSLLKLQEKKEEQKKEIPKIEFF